MLSPPGGIPWSIHFQNEFLPFIHYVIIKIRNVFFCLFYQAIFIMSSSVSWYPYLNHNSFPGLCSTLKVGAFATFIQLECELHDGGRWRFSFLDFLPHKPPRKSVWFLIKHSPDFTLCFFVLFIQLPNHPLYSIPVFMWSLKTYFPHLILNLELI